MIEGMFIPNIFTTLLGYIRIPRFPDNSAQIDFVLGSIRANERSEGPGSSRDSLDRTVRGAPKAGLDVNGERSDP